MAVSGEDISCPIAKAAFGFEERNEYYTSGKLADGMYASCAEAGAKFEEALAKYDIGEYAWLVASPLGRANFTPDTALVYGNRITSYNVCYTKLLRQGDRTCIKAGAGPRRRRAPAGERGDALLRRFPDIVPEGHSYNFV